MELQQTLDERIVVTFVEEGSPARKLGILVDDEVIEINGQNLRDMSNSFNDIKEVLNSKYCLLDLQNKTHVLIFLTWPYLVIRIFVEGFFYDFTVFYGLYSYFTCLPLFYFFYAYFPLGF